MARVVVSFHSRVCVAMTDSADFDMDLEIEAESQMQVESESCVAHQMFVECQEHAVAESLDHIMGPETPTAGPAESVVHTPRRAGGVMPLTDFPDITPPKLRRLRVKQAVPSYLSPKPLLPEATIAADTDDAKRSAWLGVEQEEFNQLNGRTKMQRLYDRMRVWKKQHRPVLVQAGASARIFKALDNFVFCCPKDDKMSHEEILNMFLVETVAPDFIKVFCQNLIKPASEVTAQRFVVNARSVLLTWNGEWGEYKDSPFGADSWPQDVVMHLQGLAWIVALWKVFLRFFLHLMELLHVDSWAASMELCTGSLENSSETRIHTHGYLKKENAKMQPRSWDIFKFRGSKPFPSSTVGGARVRQCGSNAAMYYLQCPKIGVIWQEGSKKPFRDYLVNGSWVFNLAQAGKIEYVNARSELVKTTQGLNRKLADLDKWWAENQQAELRTHVERRQAELQARLKMFRVLPEVEKWRQSESQVCFRKKFLVLEGPGGIGKTEFVKNLFGPAQTLELNMCKSDEFSLRDFVPLKHLLILWDEAKPSLVSEQRKLFQCPACWVDLGATAGGHLVYKVWLNDVIMVINSNRWSEHLDKLPAVDKAWIEANQVLVKVTESLFVQ